MSAPSDGHGRYARDPDVALQQLQADEVRQQCEDDGADHVEIVRAGYERPIQVRRR